MKILIAPDKFKGSMTALEACDAIAKGLKQSQKDLDLVLHPLADGGDGSIEILSSYWPMKRVELMVSDPLGRPLLGYYFLSEKRAFVELAVASGLGLLAQNEQNPMDTTTFGTGELIMDALKNGAEEILLFVGGSATNDGGTGIAQALGFRFFDAAGGVVKPLGKHLGQITSIDASGVQQAIKKTKLTILTDVTNPLLGESGAAFVFASQKGASQREISFLDDGLRHFADILGLGSVAKKAGMGAAGGVGASLVGLLGASLKSGVKYIMEATQFEQDLAQADWVISGEGQLDDQSLQGKVVGEVVRLAQKQGKSLALFVGYNTLEQSMGAVDIRSILGVAKHHEDAMTHGAFYLTKLANLWADWRF